MRKKLTQRERNKRRPKADDRFHSGTVAKFTNYLMWEGKKETARAILYGALHDAEKKLKDEPVRILEGAIRNVSPEMEVRSKRVGGANYQVPREVPAPRRLMLACRWIIESARSGKGSPMQRRLADELVAAYKNEGEAVKKKDAMHKMAEANRAFAHLA